MHHAIEFETKLFQGTAPRPDAINELIGGDEAASWMHGQLSKRGFTPGTIVAEDHGWDFTVQNGEKTYLIVSSCDFSDLGTTENHHIIQVANRRSFLDKLFGRNKTVGIDPMLKEVREIIERHPEMAIVSEMTIES